MIVWKLVYRRCNIVNILLVYHVTFYKDKAESVKWREGVKLTSGLHYLSAVSTSCWSDSARGGNLGMVREAVRLPRYADPRINANRSHVPARMRMEVVVGRRRGRF